MAYEAVQHKAVSIRFACAAFQISETCYRHQHQLSDGNALITRWLLALTQEHRDWGFGLCFAYIRNVISAYVIQLMQVLMKVEASR